MRFARMWTSSLVIAAAMFVSAVVGTASAQAKDPVIGKWNMNVAKSKFNPGPAPKTAAIVFSASGADGVKACSTAWPTPATRFIGNTPATTTARTIR